MPDLATAARLPTMAVIGGGQMAEALIGGLLQSGVATADRVVAADVSAERRELLKRRFGIDTETNNCAAAARGEIVVLAVKPQVLHAVLSELAASLPGRLVISIAAGVPMARLEQQLGAGRQGPIRLVRGMPNAAAMIRAGMTAVAYGPGVTTADRSHVHALFGAVGRVVDIEERLMDAVTGLSGSGPAFVCVALEALADGGVKMGLPRGVAELLAAQTLLGAARTVLESGEHPSRLKDRVASPGGTTMAGLHVLERGVLRAALIEAVEAATKRSQELNH